MNQDVKEFVTEKLHELMGAHSCCADAKAAAENWLNALGTEQEAEKTKELIAELEEDIVTADGLLAFAGSEAGAKVFGEDAPNVLAHAKALKEAGVKYCDCPACKAVEAILARKEEL